MLELIPLILIAFSAGLIDAAVGGGGLVQVPGLFATLPNQLPATLFGTNKFSAIFGTATASWRYARSVDIAWRLVIPAALTAFVCAFLGAMAVSHIPKEWMRPLVLALLLFMLGYTLRKKDFGAMHRPSHIGRRELAVALAIGGAIGFYDGLFGPGTGSFLIFLFIRFFGFDFLRASSAAKVVNLATNLAALAFFIPSGNVLYRYAIPMAMANIVGAMLGTRLAMKGGTVLIRKLFITLVSLLIAKLGWNLVH
ncbi:TSUP family transporter [Chitinimonas arctica]|uniref:Probable membrane transporter protein n=1 Tax=Chitinimonas arctica TaxID=2594795 RepID=A0A516S9Q4_9NEIS|nr:TSUP family transporter [Chitinimonas arctica]QDQ24891.1 TSUP family transporter [Chitinimonas arctica]